MATKIKVTSLDAGKRIDAFLAEKLAMSRSQLALTFKDEQVFVNGAPVKPSYRVKEGDEVTYELVERDELSLKPYDYPLDILYEDEHLLVVNKDAGLVVHPAFGHHNNTLVNALMARKTALSDGSSAFRPGIVHRLDKDTSGAIIVAKSNRVHEALGKQFKNQQVKRNYVAIVKGSLTEEAGMIKTYLTRSNLNYQKMMNTSDKGKLAITHFKVLERYKTHMLLSLELETGRTHQIRAHLEFINCSIEGDKLYGTNNRTLYKKGQLLHAHSLTFTHPVTNEELTVTAPLPSYFKEVTRQLEKYA
ncbi:MAG TPA: RluA family pseudouridine synthase [Bacilli bacterium]|nr:RluA family pseudouridine synthase [Bacilli bacterium]